MREDKGGRKEGGKQLDKTMERQGKGQSFK